MNFDTPRQNGPHFVDYIFKSVFLNNNWFTLFQISLKSISTGSIHKHHQHLDRIDLHTQKKSYVSALLSE